MDGRGIDSKHHFLQACLTEIKKMNIWYMKFSHRLLNMTVECSKNIQEKCRQERWIVRNFELTGTGLITKVF
jgi:hypothetical protein